MIISPKTLCLPVVVLLLAGCGNGEKEELRSQVDSLQTELEKSHEVSRSLVEIGTLLDSIDASRQLLRIGLVEGTAYEDYAGRMRELNDYIRNTQDKLERLEKSLQTSTANAGAYAKTIRQLKAELEKKGKDIVFLQEQVEKFRRENETLVITVDLQEAEIADKQEQIEAKSQELALIEARVQELLIQSKVSEAEAYFTRAQAIETAAERTKLAPRKKRETLREAIDLYKKALSLGKSDAQAKIEELEARL